MLATGDYNIIIKSYWEGRGGERCLSTQSTPMDHLPLYTGFISFCRVSENLLPHKFAESGTKVCRNLLNINRIHRHAIGFVVGYFCLGKENMGVASCCARCLDG